MQEALDADNRWRLEHGYDVRALTVGQLADLEPAIDASRIESDSVSYFPDEGWVDPQALAEKLCQRLRSEGCELVAGCGVTGFEFAGDRLSHARMSDGRLRQFDIFVNAAGASAAEVAAHAGISMPMANTLGAVVRIHTPEPSRIRRVIHAPTVSVRPDGRHVALLHHDSLDCDLARTGTDAAAARQPVKRLVDEAIALYPYLGSGSQHELRTTVRPMPSDGLPVIGAASDIDNFFFAVCHGGATLCVLIGDRVAREILGDAPAAELAEFRQSRFAQRA
jgi:glycine/D-amino acid oxidase-like deaminating enzyme